MRHIFIINPISGKGNALQLEEKLRRQLGQKTDLSWEIYRTKAPGDAASFVRRRAAEGPARFYACGGDGTLHEVADGVRDFPESALGVFPAGSGNDFVRTFSEPETFLDLDRQLEGEPVGIDLIRAGKHFAVNMLNIGFDCEVVNWVNTHRSIPLLGGKLRYLLGVLVMLFRRMGQSLTIRLPDGREESGRFLLCTAANGQFCGGGFRAAPLARPNDGRLELTAVRKVGRLRFLSLLGAYRTGAYLHHPLAERILFRGSCASLTLSAPGGSHVCVDGEVYPFTELQLEVLPKAIRMILPKGAALSAGEKP